MIIQQGWRHHADLPLPGVQNSHPMLSIIAQPRQGSWYHRCMVFPRQYRAVVHWIRGPTSVSETYQITLLSLLFKLSSCA